MSKSFQKEIPKARVNITLNLETGGSNKKQELPFKILAIGNFSHHQACGPVGDRQRIKITKQNFDNVLADLSPVLELAIGDGTKKTDNEQKVRLSFSAMKDFRPEAIIEQIPSLRRLLAMRNLLRDLKSNILDNHAFRRELEVVLHQKDGAKNLLARLKHVEPTVESFF